MNNITDLMMLDLVNRQWLKKEKRKEFLFLAGRYRYCPGRPDEAAFVRLLLDAGGNPKAQASLRREVQYDDKHFVHEHRDATLLTRGRDFPYKLLVSRRGWSPPGLLRDSLQDGPAFRRSDPSRDIWFPYRLSIPYLTIVDK